MNSPTRSLIAKEFHQHRWLLLSSIGGGLAGLAVAGIEGLMYFNIGMLTWLTTFVAFGVVLAMFGISNERKERALLFVLSLPLSHADYVRTKLLGLLLCYLVPWMVLTTGAVLLILARPNLPDGLLPEAILLCGFMLANFTLVLCGALSTRSEGLMTVIVIVTNMGVTLFIFLLAAIPAIAEHMREATPAWSREFWIVLAAEAAVLLTACSIPYFAASRRRDFI